MQSESTTSRIFWPGINAEISEMVSHCPTCIKYQQVQNKQPLKVHDVPTDHGTK